MNTTGKPKTAMSEMGQKTDFCRICNRHHGSEMPCPRRIANALMMRPYALEELTSVDQEWLSKNKIDVRDILEAELADRM